ncbi:translation initiation factor 2D [Trypanosoma rangeli]|uniref:Translation initiation factor 2D n=1 Tax=Trypanosoma rangeli TaxID=5698 RepID=A0A422N4G3_TRYRA|nr:translation initiation factor 2D [Trypanosoma rangeli]RNF00355.1 translation initiation factor 2D [Trypanosoma rangeli]|eukprot:RNF00355.1 translation initiation factor 2D [Trypanosoma rangeli]
MFHKKHLIKEQVVLGKKESKRLRDVPAAVLGKEYLDSLESFWKKSDTITRITWEFSTGGLTAFYVVNGIPLMFSVISLPGDSHGMFPRKDVAATPTLFFFLLMRNYYKKEVMEMISLFGATVWCRGATSQYILSGAHLMMPGIVGIKEENSKTFQMGETVFICSIGTLCPYAIGLSTERLANRATSGKGVYILHCYKDLLWDSYFVVFNAFCGSLYPVLPSTFQANEVVELATPKLNTVNAVLEEKDDQETMENATDEVVRDCVPSNRDILIQTTLNILELEDGIIDFALCETIRALSQSMLPMPLTEFSPLLISNYPRIPGAKLQIDFKRTTYKKLLPYLLMRPDLVTISEEKKGNHFVIRINKSSELLRQHRRNYAEFLQTIHEPAKEEEALEAEQQVLRDGAKGGFKRRIVSIETLYSPKNGGAIELKRMLCTGLYMDQLEQRSLGETHSQSSLLAYNEDNNDFLDELYSRKHLCDNLRKYAKTRGLLDTEGKLHGPPFVQLKDILLPLASKLDEHMRITEVEELVFERLFSPVHQIAMETIQVINGAATSVTLITKTTKRGKLPKVLVFTEKRQGNKIVTIVRGLDAYGFDLTSLAAQWKHQFSTFCTVYDPSKEMTNVKQGTRIPLELQLGGDWVSKLKVVLGDEFGLPQHTLNFSGK